MKTIKGIDKIIHDIESLKEKEKKQLLEVIYLKYFQTPKEKWLSIDPVFREKLLKNVFCVTCPEHVTEITDYEILDHKHGVLLKGKCKQCHSPVARVVEL